MSHARQTNALKVMSIMSVIFICTHSTAFDRISEWLEANMYMVSQLPGYNATRADRHQYYSQFCLLSADDLLKMNQQPPFHLALKNVLNSANKFAIDSQQYKRLI